MYRWTVKDAIEWGREVLVKADKETYIVDAEWLLADILKCGKLDLMVRQSEKLEDEVIKIYKSYLERRTKGEPVQYILEHHTFYGYNFYIDKNVLIPRFETEELAEKAIEIIRENRFSRVMDLCSGSGCIGITLLKELPLVTCTFVDVSANAMDIVKINSEKLKVADRSEFIQSDLFSNIKSDRYELIVSNPPYIVSNMIDTLDEEVMNAEPQLALDGGKDGLEFYKRICKEAKQYLVKGGYLVFEIGYDQRYSVTQLMEQNGYKDIHSYKDLYGCDRMLFGRII